MRWLARLAAVLALGVAQVTVACDDRDSDSSTGRSQTAGAATIWAVGDGADGSPAARRVARLIAHERPTRFIYLGDVYPLGRAEDFRGGYDPVYGRLRGRTLPTPGNHEWANHAQGYDRYWRRVAGRRAPHFYSVRLAAAGWTLISLNSEASLEPGSPQLRWLRRGVSGGGNCRIGFWHRPRFSAGPHGDQPDVAPLWRILRGRSKLILNGHDHNMQELVPARGTRTLVAGAGGHGLYPLDRRHPRLAWGSARTPGALRLRLTPGVARYAFVSDDGRVLRRGLIRCRQ